MPSLWLAAVAAVAALPPPVTITWTPVRPLQGSLVRLVVAGDSILSITGKLEGEPLHFERDSVGALVAFGGVPVDLRRNLRFPLILERSGGVDTLQVEIPVFRAAFGKERLSVAREFTDRPDSALQARIDREADLIAAVWPRSHKTPRLWHEPFARPRGSRITSPFGTGREFNGVIQNRHLGVDFDGRVGDPIVAANDGVVALTGDFYYSGRCVFVDHGRGIATAYLHMTEVLVAQGDTVKKGQLIGRVGATGRVTGPHLHWIAKYGRISVNPMSLLRLGGYGRAGG